MDGRVVVGGRERERERDEREGEGGGGGPYNSRDGARADGQDMAVRVVVGEGTL
jgi:hypothetical protein